MNELPISGCYLLEPRVLNDKRGKFVKSMAASEFQKAGLRSDFVEQYWSATRPGVIRGMHFQIPPHAHAKLVYCVAGEVLDVLLDIRVNSLTYGQVLAIPLVSASGHGVYIPEGVAHGFSVRDEAAKMVYLVTSEYSPDHDKGIRWDSFGFEWNIERPVISERDSTLPALKDYRSPF